jgi:DNA replication and repair protein RecF
MSIKWLTIRHLRIIENAELTPSPGVNLITGPNAAGKTSFLEAIDILSRGRSFRSHRLERLVTTGESELTIAARLCWPRHPAINIGLERSRRGTRIRIQGQTAESIAELAMLLPVQVIHPESHQLIQGAPAYRRAYLDWGTFHVDRRFLTVWQRYRRALRQRNAALRAAAEPGTIRAWHAELSETGQFIDHCRRDYFRTLAPVINDYARILPGANKLELHYRRGWSQEYDLETLLERDLIVDRQRGHTHLGPHRAELEMRLNRQPVSGTASRGQQKLLAAALRLAQARLFTEQTERSCLFLVDDLPAELESRNRSLLLQALAELNSQVFITAIDTNALDLSMWLDSKMFHVEHGYIRELI